MLDEGEQQIHQDRVLPRPRVAVDEPTDIEKQVIHVALARPRLLVDPASSTASMLGRKHRGHHSPDEIASKTFPLIDFEG